MKLGKFSDWIFRFVKGMFIGSGFILPGVSGGALAAVFGIYERIISFLAHITRDFKKNLLFFIPVGLGGLTGLFLLSFVVSGVLGEQYEPYALWFFIGCIIGTAPALWKQAGKKGRKTTHMGVMAAAFVVGLALLILGNQKMPGGVPLNFGTWMMGGALIGLGVIVPGLSPSNFLVYFGMYKAMSDSIKTFDLSVIIPLFIGVIACVLLFSKLMDYLLSKIYAGMFHAVLGIVLASTVMIIPMPSDTFTYLNPLALICIVTCAAGVALGWWMSRLEDKYKPE